MPIHKMHPAALFLLALGAAVVAKSTDTVVIRQGSAVSPRNHMPVIQDVVEQSMKAATTSGRISVTLPPIVPPPMMTFIAQDQVVMGPHGKRQAKSTALKLTTDLYSETLKHLPKPGPMPTTSVHYDAAWTSSVSSQLSEAVKKARTMTSKTPEQKSEEEKSRIIASVTSAQAGLISASIASSSASSVEAAEASAKARESKALKGAKHTLEKWSKDHKNTGSASQKVPVVEFSSLLSVAVVLMGALCVL